MLTDVDCKNVTCPPDKARKRLTDAGGLYLEVSPSGSKRWFWKVYRDGKESRLALGSYPARQVAQGRFPTPRPPSVVAFPPRPLTSD